MGFLETHWTKHVLLPMDGIKQKVIQLEEFRRQLKLPHKDFAGMVMTSAAYFRMGTDGMAGTLQHEFRNASDQQINAGIAVLYSHLDLKKTKGMFTIETFMQFREHFRDEIDAAIFNPYPILEKLQVRSRDALTARLFHDIGTYERCPRPVCDIYLQVDTILGWKYRLDYDEVLDAVTQWTNDELDKKRILTEGLKEIVAHILEKEYNKCLERLEAGEDFDTIMRETSTRLKMEKKEFQALFIQWLSAKGSK